MIHSFWSVDCCGSTSTDWDRFLNRITKCYSWLLALSFSSILLFRIFFFYFLLFILILILILSFFTLRSFCLSHNFLFVSWSVFYGLTHETVNNGNSDIDLDESLGCTKRGSVSLLLFISVSVSGGIIPIFLPFFTFAFNFNHFRPKTLLMHFTLWINAVDSTASFCLILFITWFGISV